MSRGLPLLLALLLLAAVPAGASAGTPPSSAFSALSGPGSCATVGLPTDIACANTDGSASTNESVIVTPDDRQVIVITGAQETGHGEEGTNAIVTYNRDATTGALSFASCVSNTGGDDQLGSDGVCTDADALSGLNAVALTPDGKALFATAYGSSSLVWFDRDPATGKLTQAGCLKNFSWPGEHCRTAPMLGGANGVAVSADGSTVLVTAERTGSVTTFHRDQATGTLERVSCISDTGSDGLCTDGYGLRGARDIVTTADGAEAFVVATKSDAVTRFSIDKTTGALVERQCLAAKVADGGACRAVESLGGAHSIQLGGDESELLVGAAGINLFKREADGTLTSTACLESVEPPLADRPASEDNTSVDEDTGNQEDTPPTGTEHKSCTGIPELGTSNITLSADGKVLFASEGYSTTTILRRDAVGQPFTWHACAQVEITYTKCSTLGEEGISGPLATTREGRFLYAAKYHGVAVFQTAAAVASSASVRRSGVLTTTIGCPAAHLTPCSGAIEHDNLRAPARFAVAAGTTSRLTMKLRPSATRRFQSGRLRGLTVKVRDASHKTRVARTRVQLHKR